MRVLFVANPAPRSLPRGEEYVVGHVYDLRPDQAERWKRRGCAVDVPLEPAPVVVAKPVAAPEPPRPRLGLPAAPPKSSKED